MIPRDANNRGGNIFLWRPNNDHVTLVSHAPNGDAGNNFSQRPQISADGKFIVFHSLASNLVEGDNNNKWDVFLYNVDRNTIERVSLFNGMEGNDNSRKGSVSGNGKIIAFQSVANNWLELDIARDDIYVTDLSRRTFSLISRGLGSERANQWSGSPHVSADGGWVTFVSAASNLVEGDRNGVPDIFVHRMGEKRVRRVSIASDGTEANGRSFNPLISRDGRSVVFESDASNLVEGDTNGVRDIFRHDLSTGETVRLSTGPDFAEANGQSEYPDFSMLGGGASAFHSEATNLATDFGGILRDHIRPLA